MESPNVKPLNVVKGNIFRLCPLGCKDISGEWCVSDGRSETFTQNQCEGSSSFGYTYTVVGLTATTDNGVSGTINDKVTGITWSNGLSFISGKVNLTKR